MPGGLIQLISYGKENLYLSGDPEITFFKIIYRRYTNFSIEPVSQYFKNSPDFGKRVTCSISKNADLINRIYVCVRLPNIISKYKNIQFAWAKKIGFALIKSVEIEIGGNVIDKQYGDWMNIWYELNSIKYNEKGFNKMIGNVKELTDFSNSKKSYMLYIPLSFWFCLSDGLSLPIIALQYSDIKIHLTFNAFKDCYKLNPTNYIEIEENIVLFEKNEVICQNIDNEVIYAYFTYFNVINNRLYYQKSISRK